LRLAHQPVTAEQGAPPSSAATGPSRTACTGPRHGLRRRPLPDPHRQRPPRHGQPAHSL